MQLRDISFLTIALAALCGPLANPASAQASRTWVSTFGDDGNSCSRANPCATFATALAATAAGGEINCVDSGAFASVTITKSVTINCEAHFAGVLAAGTNGITVNVTGADIVTLRGLDIEGVATGTNGIRFIGAGTLHIQHSTIRNFRATNAASGILVAPTGAARLFISDTVVSDNGNGILIKPTGSGSVKGALEGVQAERNNIGIDVSTVGLTGSGVNLTVSDSIMAGSNSRGLGATTGSGPAINVMVDNSALVNNGGPGAFASGALATVRLAKSSLTGNNVASSVASSGKVLSYGNNRIDANTTVGTLPAKIVER